MRHFSLGLHFHGTQSYEYVRRAFNNNLPSSKTVRTWMANSDINGDPGIQATHMEKLKRISADYEQKFQKKMVCSLVFDEMSIRQQIYYSPYQREYVGYVDIEASTKDGDNSEKRVAKQAIVFILNGINVNFEFPVAYFFIDTLNKSQRRDVVDEIIRNVTAAGVKVSNLTFDGYAANIGMCELFGADLDIFSPTFQTFILNPSNEEKIYIVQDPCHMEKLLRNVLARNEILYDGNNDQIEWKYIVSLYNYTRNDSIRCHKITKKHIQWQQNIMNVRVAVETMSESVACYMEYLMNQRHPEFIDAAPTIKFIRTVNILFDIFNSRSKIHSNLFKRSLNKENARVIFDFFDSTIAYLKSLKIEVTRKSRDKHINGVPNDNSTLVPLLQSRSKTGVRGFIVDMVSLKSMFAEFVEGSGLLDSVPTYYLLQDVIEIFFGKIRACGGYNNNPNVHQFKGAYRKLLSNIKVVSSVLSNCRVFDADLPDHYNYSNVYFVSSRRARIAATDTEEFRAIYDQQKESIISDVNNSLNKINHDTIDTTTNFSTAYIAASIEQKISNCAAFYCDNCRSVFDENPKIEDVSDANVLKWRPCRSTFKICRAAENFFKLYDIRAKEKKYDFRVLYCLIFRTLDFDTLFVNSSFSCDSLHKYQLIKCIVGQYIGQRAANVSKDITLDRFDSIFRQKLNHMVTFSGQ